MPFPGFCADSGFRLAKIRLCTVTLQLCLTCCWFPGCSGPAPTETLRPWTDVSGNIIAHGDLVKIVNGQVYLRNSAGEEVVLSIAMLSQDNRNYLYSDEVKQAFAQVDNQADEQINNQAAEQRDNQAHDQDENPFRPIALAEAEAVSDSPFQPTGTPQANGFKGSGASSLVVVGAEVEGKNYLAPGLVCGEYNGQAYVIADLYLSNFKSRHGTFVPFKVPESLFASWESDGQQHKVNLELVHFDVRQSKWVLRGPAQELPPAFVGAAATPVAERQQVQLTSVRITSNVKSYNFATIPSEITKVFRTASDVISHYIVTGPSAQRGDWKAVADKQGQQIGVIMVPHDVSQPPPEELLALLPQSVDFWKQPSSYYTFVYPISGDVEKIRWQVVVEYSDPLEKMSQCYLLYQPQPMDASLLDPRQKIRFDAHTNEPFAQGLERVELKPGKPTAEFLKYMQATEELPFGNYLVGEFETSNLGKVFKRLQFKLQMAYTTANRKELVYLPATHSEFDINICKNKRYALTIPDIPGFDGIDLSSPRATKSESGYKITSDSTQPNPPMLGAVPPKAPQPDQASWKLLGKPKKSDQYTAWELTIPSQVTMVGKASKRCLMIPSLDGKWLYLTDYDDVMYRLDAEKMTVSCSLQLPETPTDAMVSRQGLVVYFSMYRAPSSKNPFLWQLDADTLEVKREYQISDVQSLATTPASDYCYIGCKTRHGEDKVTLGILDLAQGKMLHWIPGQHNNRDITTSLGPPLGADDSIALRATKDGRYLFIGARQFLIQGSDLILESYGKTKNITDFKQFFLNGDGKYLCFDAISTERGKSFASMYVGQDFKDKFQTCTNLPSDLTIEVVPRAESLYYVHEWINYPSSQKDNRMCIYNIAGEKKFDFKIEDLSVMRVVVLLSGSRIVTKGEKSFTIYDIHPNVLREK